VFEVYSIILLEVENDRIHPRKVLARYQDNVLLVCKSEGDTRWTFNGGILPFNVVKFNKTSVRISGVSYENAGTYKCIGTYKEYRIYFSASAQLKIQGKYNSIVLLTVCCNVLLGFFSP